MLFVIETANYSVSETVFILPQIQPHWSVVVGTIATLSMSVLTTSKQKTTTRQNSYI